MEITVHIPEGATIGDLTLVRGSLFDAAVTYVDWESLREKRPGAVAAPGVILLDMAHQLAKGA